MGPAHFDDDQVAAATAAIEGALPSESVLAIYLYGSAVIGGLRPDSDLDLAVVTARRLTPTEKLRLFAMLRPLSRRSLRGDRERPLEVTVLAHPDLRPWRYPPRLDAQYGEWLTDAELDDQANRGPSSSPDLAILVTMLTQASRAYRGRPAAEVLDPVPHDDLMRALSDALPELFADLEDDTRNVLLTLARMWMTALTGAIGSKDEAATWAALRLPIEQRALLDEARDLYLRGGWGAWAPAMAEVRELGKHLSDEIRHALTAR